jgi:hypothetical protein
MGNLEAGKGVQGPSKEESEVVGSFFSCSPIQYTDTEDPRHAGTYSVAVSS